MGKSKKRVRKKKTRICVDCGCEIWADRFYKSVEETRCKPCGYKARSHGRWQGGESINFGYVQIHNPEHPRATKRGYVNRSHLVWEATNGRYIQPGEVIHHIDGNKANDVIENLRLMANSEHTSLHCSGRKNPTYKHGEYVGRYKNGKYVPVSEREKNE